MMGESTVTVRHGSSSASAVLLAVLWFPGAASGIAADEDPGSEAAARPSVGLVLAGGGARGVAHIGALKVLEEQRVPVDFIAGTSMGAIVGALYAVGYSPVEMEEILGRIDWESLFRDRPDRRFISFRLKEDDRRALLPVEMGVGRQGFSSKGGIVTASRVESVFQAITLDAAAVESFDNLRIPYRAVAADLATGDAVVLDHGNLADAMRASMSIPAVFTPVVIDGRVLVDGGIVDNLPVDVAREMGAQRILAIDVGTPPRGSAEGLSAAGVMSQTLSVVTERFVIAQRESLTSQDLLITPDLEGITAGSFTKMAEAIAAGEEAARQNVGALQSFSVSESEFAAFLQRQRRGTSSLLPSVVIDEIEVRGVPRLDPSLITRRMKTKPGEPLDLRMLQDDLTRINMIGEFEKVGFRVEREGERDRLVVEARSRSWGPGYLRAGIGVETTFDGGADFGLTAYYRRPEINALGAELKTTISAGHPSALFSEFYQPLSASGRWFTAVGTRIENRRNGVVVPGGDFEEVKERQFEGSFDLGRQLRNYGELRAGVVGGRSRFSAATTSTLPEIDARVGGLRFRFTLDQVDNVFFPTKGNYTHVETFASREGLGADDEYEKATFATLQALTLWRNTFLGSVLIGTDLGSDVPVYDQFQLGGFLKLSGFKRGSLRGDVLGLFTLADYVMVGSLGPLGSLYAGLAWQAGNTWQDADDAEWGDLVQSGTFFLGVDNKITPVYLGYGYAEGGSAEVYLFIGRAF